MQVRVFDYLHADAVLIRDEVFVDEQGFKNEYDEFEMKARHLVFYIDDAPVATCRYLMRDDGALLGRIAVRKAFRGRGLGAQMIHEAEKFIDCERILIHAQCRAREFYEKQGFSAFSEIDDEEGVPHIWMKKENTSVV